MSTPVQRASAPVEKPSFTVTVITKPFSVFIGLIKWLGFALLFSIIIELIGITFIWSNEGSNHAKELLDYDLRFLSSTMQDSLTSIQPKDYIFNHVQWLSQMSADYGLNQYMNQLQNNAREYAFAVYYICLSFLIRTMILFYSMPLFILIGMVGFVDGVVARELRRWGGGKESSWLFHRFYALVPVLCILPWVIYLGVPLKIHPNSIVVPTALITAMMIFFSTKTFKKYM